MTAVTSVVSVTDMVGNVALEQVVKMTDKDGTFNLVNTATAAAVLPDGNGGCTPCPDLLTEDELIRFLRIPEVSRANNNYRNVIANLKRFRSLPCVHVCRQPLYPRDAIMEWVKEQTK